MDHTVSVVMPIFNQERLIERVLRAAFDNVSGNVREFFLILDCCTDNSEAVVRSVVASHERRDQVHVIKNEVAKWETICCNIGFRKSTCSYSLNIQDDMILGEKNFDEILMRPFVAVDNVLGVTARDALDVRIDGEDVSFFNVAGRDVGGARNVFSIRDAINRGPILFNNARLRELNFLDEDFAPLAFDDVDLSIRGHKKGYVVGSYMASYESKQEWGGTRKSSEASATINASQCKNQKLLIDRHKEFILSTKNGRDIAL